MGTTLLAYPGEQGRPGPALPATTSGTVQGTTLPGQHLGTRENKGKMEDS